MTIGFSRRALELLVWVSHLITVQENAKTDDLADIGCQPDTTFRKNRILIGANVAIICCVLRCLNCILYEGKD
jgi:hypothetical protein